mgnify:CR=1 FL=1
MKHKFWSGFTSVMLAVAFLLQAGNLAWKMYQGKQPQAAIAPAKQYARVQMDWNAVKLESNVWKIHREGQADSYLLGTYHIGKKGDAMNPALKDLIARNQKIITEVVSEPPEAEIKNLAQNAMRSNVPLTEKMGRRPFDALVRKMNTYPEGKSLSQNLKYVKPWAGVLFVMGLRDKDEDGNTGAESFIYRETARLGKEHGALETHTEATMYFALIPDDLESTDLPRMVKPYKDKLFGLTIQPERLQAIRQERHPNSTYSKIDTCRSEIADAQNMFKRHGIPFTNTTDKSVEELAVHILQACKLKRRF